MYRINTIAGEAMARKGHATYPEDFPHLPPGQDFVAWKSGEDWEIETTLKGAAFEARLKRFTKDILRYRVITYCGDSGADDKREYSSIKETGWPQGTLMGQIPSAMACAMTALSYMISKTGASFWSVAISLILPYQQKNKGLSWPER